MNFHLNCKLRSVCRISIHLCQFDKKQAISPLTTLMGSVFPKWNSEAYWLVKSIRWLTSCQSFHYKDSRRQQNAPEDSARDYCCWCQRGCGELDVRTHARTHLPSPVTYLPFIFPLVWRESSSLWRCHLIETHPVVNNSNPSESLGLKTPTSQPWIRLNQIYDTPEVDHILSMMSQNANIHSIHKNVFLPQTAYLEKTSKGL